MMPRGRTAQTALDPLAMPALTKHKQAPPQNDLWIATMQSNPQYGVEYGLQCHIIPLFMKTRVERDEPRLKRVMPLAGVKTRREVIALTLREAERVFRLNKLLDNALPDSEYVGAIDPNYRLNR